MASTRHDPAGPGRPSSRPAPTPQRPSKAVYRRRQLVALIILLTVLALLVWGVSAVVGMVADRSSGDAAAAAVQAGDGGSAQSTPPGDGGAAATSQPGDTAATAPPRPDDGATQSEACAPDDVDTEVDAPAGAGPGEPVLFQLTVTNTGEDACLLDAGGAALAVTAHVGEDRVWSSADCAMDGAGRELLLEAGGTTTTRIPWDKSRSTTGCPGGQDRAPAGSYQVTTSYEGTGVGAETSLLLE